MVALSSGSWQAFGSLRNGGVERYIQIHGQQLVQNHSHANIATSPHPARTRGVAQCRGAQGVDVSAFAGLLAHERLMPTASKHAGKVAGLKARTRASACAKEQHHSLWGAALPRLCPVLRVRTGNCCKAAPPCGWRIGR